MLAQVVFMWSHALKPVFLFLFFIPTVSYRYWLKTRTYWNFSITNLITPILHANCSCYALYVLGCTDLKKIFYEYHPLSTRLIVSLRQRTLTEQNEDSSEQFQSPRSRSRRLRPLSSRSRTTLTTVINILPTNLSFNITIS